MNNMAGSGSTGAAAGVETEFNNPLSGVEGGGLPTTTPARHGLLTALLPD